MKAISTLDAIKKYSFPLYRTKICELTINYNCNAKCVFCYTEDSFFNSSGKLDLQKSFKYMRTSFEDGARIIQFIGGEPTIYPELDKLISISKKIGYKAIQIVTNGLKLSDISYFKHLIDVGLNSVVFSVHGADEKIHDRVVGVDGAFKKINKAIEYAVRKKIHITIGTAVTSINYKEIPKIARWAYENYGIENYHFIAVHFIGEADKNTNVVGISYFETKPYIIEALEYLYLKNVFPLSPILSNYLPCILPGFENLISDWKLPYSFDDDLYLPEKVYKASMYTMITDRLRMKSKKCRECIYFKICAGFEKKYFERYGDKEFSPLLNIPSPFGMNTFYKK